MTRFSIMFLSRSVPLRAIAYVGIEAISDGRFTYFKDLGADQPVFSHREIDAVRGVKGAFRAVEDGAWDFSHYISDVGAATLR